MLTPINSCIHEVRLKDVVTTKTYQNVIYKNKIVIDVGAEACILSLFCAKAGAKHVYDDVNFICIPLSQCFQIECLQMADMAKEIVKVNVITVLKGKVEEIDLPVPKVDIIISEWTEAALWMKSVYADRPPQLKTASSDMQLVTTLISREPVFDELDDIIKIKLAEAQMFQTRADDARKEAEGLNHIAQAKSKKIDDEFTSRVMKLHLSEAEEMRRQKLKELQTLENAHQEYFNMKVRMEREIKDLLKMEATKRNFSS
ncbi:protein OBERON 4 [Tanacetum coccineum]